MPPEPWRIGVHDLHQARAALAWSAAGGHAAVLYGLDARRMGVAFWREVELRLDRPLVVDCAAHVGTVLAALRVGLKRLAFVAPDAQLAALDGLLAVHGAARVVTPPDLRLAPGISVAAQLARRRFEEVTDGRSTDKERPDRFNQ